MIARHWHVVENTPGYLPDSDPVAFSARRYAVAYATELARELRETGYQGRTSFARFGYGHLERPARVATFDLGRTIDIVECSEADCLARED